MPSLNFKWAGIGGSLGNQRNPRGYDVGLISLTAPKSYKQPASVLIWGFRWPLAAFGRLRHRFKPGAQDPANAVIEFIWLDSNSLGVG